MSTDQKRRPTPFDERWKDVPFRDIGKAGELAPETPLTREAVIHLRAAAMEIDDTLATVASILRTVEGALAEPSGGDKVLSEDRRMDLARVLSEAEKMSREAGRACFERGRGERPHGGVGGAETGDGTVTLSEDDVRRLNVLLAAVQLAADGHFGGYGDLPDRTPTAIRAAFKDVLDHVDTAVQKIEAAHPVKDREDFLSERGETLERVVGCES